MPRIAPTTPRLWQCSQRTRESCSCCGLIVQFFTSYMKVVYTSGERESEKEKKKKKEYSAFLLIRTFYLNVMVWLTYGGTQSMRITDTLFTHTHHMNTIKSGCECNYRPIIICCSYNR